MLGRWWLILSAAGLLATRAHGAACDAFGQPQTDFDIPGLNILSVPLKSTGPALSVDVCCLICEARGDCAGFVLYEG